MQPVSFRTKVRRKLSGTSFHTNPLVDVVMRRRGVYASSRMEYDLRDLHTFDSLKGIEDARRIISDSIVSDKKILILADYDCDGATSCAVMVRGLRMLGAKHVDYSVPDRFTMGYGTTPALVDSIVEKHPDLIITVDNGISSFEGIERIREVLPNTQIVVTDHHMAPKDGSLPDADAIVNPNQHGCNFPSKAIAGCGVAWYTTIAVRAFMRENGLFQRIGIEEPNLAYLVDLVALGTVADVVALDYNNRTIVSVGINLIRSGGACLGINALANSCGKDLEEIVSSDFAFSFGPKINSAGRLTDMRYGIECLLSDDPYYAGLCAKELSRTNDTRKDIQNWMIDIANDMVKELPDSNLSIVVANEDFNEGVVGLVASRIKESFGVPTFIFTKNDEGMMKGSGRSVDGAHLFNILNELQDAYKAKTGEKLMEGFGGHAMAAGLSIKPENLDTFTQMLDDVVRNYINKPFDVIETDGLVNASHLTMDNIEELKMASPFGQGFPEPVLETKLKVLKTRKSKDKKHLFYDLSDGFSEFTGIAFNYSEKEHLYRVPEGEDDIHLVFRPDVSEFRGKTEFKMILEAAI
jgi:single-stranded-DNA-specific exonuclease